MAVLVMSLALGDLAFVLHTAWGDASAGGTVYAEVCVGLGETLASGVEGTPYRLACPKAPGGEVETLAMASFSEKLVRGATGGVERVKVDYLTETLSVDAAARRALGGQLAALGQRLETSLGGAQDVEGVVVDGELVVVQSRPQPMAS